MNQMTAPIKRRTMARIMLVIILRFLLIGFFSFLGFLDLALAGEEFAEAFNSPVCSSKSKAWTGFKKSEVSDEWTAGFFAVMGDGEDFGTEGDLELDFGVEDGLEFDLGVGFGLRTSEDFFVDFALDGLVEAAVLERRVVSPSIDLFFSIVYNYNMKAMKLTKKQLAILNFLEDFEAENGYSPSYREIMSGLGLSSVSAVAEHVDNLVAKGVLKKVPGAARSLEVLDYKHEDTVKLFQAKLIDATDPEKKVLESAAEILGLDLTL